MDYSAHYSRLIERAKSRVLTGYVERHHVVPRCLGGGDEVSNIVALTGAEHYVAHQLLVRIHPGNPKLIFACHAMLMSGRTRSRSENKEFEWLRRLNAKALGDRVRGRPVSEETRRKIGEAGRGRVPTEKQRAAVRAALAGKPKSPEHVAKVAAALTGKPGTRLGHITPESTREEAARSRLSKTQEARLQTSQAA